MQLAHIRNELPRDRVGRVFRVDQLRHRGRDGNRITGAHAREIRL
jgi:hypothetical protein